MLNGNFRQSGKMICFCGCEEFVLDPAYGGRISCSRCGRCASLADLYAHAYAAGRKVERIACIETAGKVAREVQADLASGSVDADDLEYHIVSNLRQKRQAEPIETI